MDKEAVLVLLGSNQGNRLNYLNQAKKLIRERIGNILKESSIYETMPWGKTDQEAFLNQVIEIETLITPMALLAILLKIEADMGRIRVDKWGARLIDLDILYFGQRIIKSDSLTLPHPGIAERRFTLVPLADCWAPFTHPVLQKRNSELLEDCIDTLEVKLFKG